MSEFDYEAIKTELTMFAQDEDEAGFLDYAKSVRHYIAAIKALQAEAELGAKIEKLTGEGRGISFYRSDPNRLVYCEIRGFGRLHRGSSSTPSRALNNAIYALGED